MQIVADKASGPKQEYGVVSQACDCCVSCCDGVLNCCLCMETKTKTSGPAAKVHSKEEPTTPLLDAGASSSTAVVDHLVEAKDDHSVSFAPAIETPKPAIIADRDDADPPQPKTPGSLRSRRSSVHRMVEVWPWHIINPTSTWKVQWDTMIMMLILYAAASVPVRVAFAADAEGAMWVLEASMSVIFIIDIMFTFNTAILVEGEWVTAPGKIAGSYVRGWFLIDCPSSVPVELIELALPAGNDTGFLGALRFLRVFRLFRLLRLLKVEQTIALLEEYLDTSLKAMSLVMLVSKLLFVSHLLACGWFFAGTLAGEDEVSWVEAYDPTMDTVSRQYLASFYWAVTTLTTVGYGDITPNTDAERQYAIFALLMCSLIFAYIVGDISSLIEMLNRQHLLVHEKMDSVKEYLMWREIPRDLSVRVKRYYEYFYTKSAVFDEAAILSGLNPALHAEIVQHVLARTLGRAPVFAMFSMEFKLAMFPLLKPLSVGPGELLFEKGAPATALVFLLDGEIEVLSELDNATPIRMLRANEEDLLSFEDETIPLITRPTVGCFGQDVLVGHRRKETHRAASPCEMLIITKSDLALLFKADRISARRICTVVLRGFFSQERLRSLAWKFRITVCRDPRLRAAMIMQYAWRRYMDIQMQENDEIYSLVANQFIGRQLSPLGFEPSANGHYASPRLREERSARPSPMELLGTAMRSPATAAPVAAPEPAKPVRRGSAFGGFSAPSAPSAAAPTAIVPAPTAVPALLAPRPAPPQTNDPEMITLRRDIFDMMKKGLDVPDPEDALRETKVLFDAMMRRIEALERKVERKVDGVERKVDAVLDEIEIINPIGDGFARGGGEPDELVAPARLPPPEEVVQARGGVKRSGSIVGKLSFARKGSADGPSAWSA